MCVSFATEVNGKCGMENTDENGNENAKSTEIMIMMCKRDKYTEPHAIISTKAV